MSRKQSEDSSLELLLDTMCNTFGGVMFIAISLAVMISMRNAVAQQAPDHTAEIEKLKKETAVLAQQLASRMKETDELVRTARRMKDDPRLQIVNEIAFLEQQLKEKKLKEQLLERQAQLSRTELDNTKLKTQKISDSLLEAQKEESLLSQKKDTLDKQLAELKNRISGMTPQNMVFNTLVKKDQTPYFILLRDGKSWAVGPEIRDGVSRPLGSVSPTVSGGRVICRPAGEGVPVFSGDGFSSGFQALLKSIPADRIPEFVLARGEAENFYKLRNILKNEGIFHGFYLQRQENGDFSYQLTNVKTRYEY